MIEDKFINFVNIVKKVRKECPWDKEQTNDSIKANTIEEAFEVAEAIDNQDYDELKIELGDLFLHILFHSIIAEDNNKFNLEDVIDGISAKLIRRHPHVFGDVKNVNTADEVKKNWENIKFKEGRKSVLEGVPAALPSLQQAYRLQEKASKGGFDWENKTDVWKKVDEELGEFKEAEASEVIKDMEEEFGDILFALVNYARFCKIDPEAALRKTNKKFIKRFNYIEKELAKNGKNVFKSNLCEMDKYWEESKKHLK